MMVFVCIQYSNVSVLCYEQNDNDNLRCNESAGFESSKPWKTCLMGGKVTCGFMMLCSRMKEGKKENDTN